MRFLSSTILLLVLIPLAVWAQKPDTLKKSFIPTGIRVGTDVLSLVRNQTDESFSGWEVSADMDFYRYFLVVETGRWQRNFNSPERDYRNDGAYWRVGIDVNFLKKDPEKNMLFLGARYASGTFDEQLTILTDDVWNTGTFTFVNSGTKASWAELTGGLRVKMWKFLWLGYTARYKFALNTKESTNLVPYDVPGYGRTDSSSTWGFNYQVLIRVPIGKKS